ncbi:MAG TPA: glycosyltransferase family 39 protein, partial [Solirubrobacteraceae bacterium]|nr:glycosyltransferase family 39 protein [Solirubrobacteraceae bacterium]
LAFSLAAVSVGSLAHSPVHPPLSRRGADAAELFGKGALIAVAAMTAAAAVLRFYGLGRQGFWYDEANTALLVHLSPGKMLGLLPQSESTPPLYYCIAWIWVRIFGDHEAGLRSLSALAGVLVVPVAYGAAAKLISRRAGLITAALTACSPLLIWYSQEARAYELMVLFTAVSLLAFAYALKEPTGRVMTAWTVACALAMATHYYALVAVVPQALWLLVVHRRVRSVQIAVGVLVLCGLALLPLAITQNGTKRDSWIAHSDFGVRLRQIIPQFLIGTNAPHRLVVKYLAMALAVVALGLLAFRAGAAERRGALLAGGLAVAGFVLALVFVAGGFDDLITRNIIALWLPAAILIAGGLAAERARTAGVVIAAVLCAIGVFATAGIAAQRDMQRPDWRYVTRALGTGRPAAPGRAILIQHYSYLLPLSLYLPGLRDVHTPVRVRELDVISMVSPQQPLCWWGAACNLIPSEMQRRYDIPGLHVVSRRHVLQWTILKMVAKRPVTLSRADVARALHTTSLPRDELIDQPG